MARKRKSKSHPSKGAKELDERKKQDYQGYRVAQGIRPETGRPSAPVKAFDRKGASPFMG